MMLLVFVLLSSVTAALKTAIITGANSGVGFAGAKQLAATNEWRVVLACRSLEKAERARAQMPNPDNVEVRLLDLADLASVKKFCDEWGPARPLHVLALNAGVQKQTDAFAKELIAGDAVPRTAQGFEETIGTNHIGHFYMSQLLLKNIRAAGGGRVVWTGSGVHDPSQPGGDVGSKATLGDLSGLAAGFTRPVCMIDSVTAAYDPDKAYKDSKLCNVMTSLEMARRLAEAGGPAPITSNVFNPGLIPTTGLFRSLNPFFVLLFTALTRYVFRVAETEEEGGRRLAYMVADPALDKVTGGYFTGKPYSYPFQLATPSAEAQDQDKAKKLWALSEKIIQDRI